MTKYYLLFTTVLLLCFSTVGAQDGGKSSSRNGGNTIKSSSLSADKTGATIDEQSMELNQQLEDELEQRKKTDDAILHDSLPRIFGNEIFNNSSSSFAPNTNIPTPANYVMGPGDKLNIDVTGISLVSWELTVAPDGSILIPRIGKLYIGGMTIENATRAIEAKLAANNFAIGQGTNVSVTLANIRTINITIMGEVRNPGNYPVSSLTTLFNALYLSGGISRTGSFRNVELIRDNMMYRTVDLYDYLLRGDLSNNEPLRDGDIIRVPTYSKRVGITGEVKRPALYEVQAGETLRDVIRFAGDFTEFAYTNNIKVKQVTDKEYRVRDIQFRDITNYIPLNGDQYTVARILNRYENRVSIDGAVYRPGAEYELEAASTVKSLIEKADGLKEDAYLDRAYLIRMNENSTMEIVPFNLGALMDNEIPDIPLQREDVATISSIFDLSDSSKVSIYGMVRRPGTYNYFYGMSVEDLILAANGFSKGANFQQIQIARAVKNSDKRKRDARLAEIIIINVDPNLSVADAKYILEPGDIVSIFPLTGYATMIASTIEGEVMQPGSYALARKNDRISDLVRRAGGFTDDAYLEGASLVRAKGPETLNEAALDQFKIQSLAKMIHAESDRDVNTAKRISDTAAYAIALEAQPKFVSIDLRYIMKHPGSTQDLILKDGDRLSVPIQLQTVKITGQVNWPNIAVYQSGKTTKDYILDNGGGFREGAFKRKTYVVYPNGSTRGKRFLAGYPAVKPGAEIIVPYRTPRPRVGLRGDGLIGLATSLTTVATMIFGIITLSRNK